MQSPAPRHWRLAGLAIVVAIASFTVLGPAAYLASVTPSGVSTLREKVRQEVGLKKGRTVPLGGRGQAQPTRVQKKTMSGLARRIRTKPFGRGDLPELTNAQKRMIRRRGTTKASLRGPEIITTETTETK